MLKLARLKPGEKLVDLGSGDGRILIEASGGFGARSLGVEVREGLVRESRKKIREAGLGDVAKVVRQRFRESKLADADVVAMYLSSYTMGLVQRKLKREMRERARVVTFDFQIFGWKPSAVVQFTPKGWRKSHPVYLYDKASIPRRSER